MKGVGLYPRLGGDVDDPTQPPLPHVWQHGPGEPHRREEVEPQDPEPVLVRKLLEERRAPYAARLVDEDVDAPAARNGLLRELLYLVRVAHIRRHRLSDAPRRTDLLRRLL